MDVAAPTWVAVLPAGELAPGQWRLVDAAGLAIVIWNVAGELHATENACPHQGGPLSEGHLDGTVVSCPWHGWPFDVRTGRHQRRPEECLRTFPVRNAGEQIEVAI